MKTNTIRHKIVGDMTIDEDTELHGMIAGTVTVAEDAILQLHGKVVDSERIESAYLAEAIHLRPAALVGVSDMTVDTLRKVGIIELDGMSRHA